MKKKLIITGCLIVFVAIFVLIDWIISLGYKIQVLDIDPNPGICDGQTVSKITIQLTKTDGTPVEGHNLRILSLKAGTFPTYRILTDENGIAVFDFIPYLSTAIRGAEPIPMRVRDESNSIFVAIPVVHEFVFDTCEPEGGIGDSGMTSDSFWR